MLAAAAVSAAWLSGDEAAQKAAPPSAVSSAGAAQALSLTGRADAPPWVRFAAPSPPDGAGPLLAIVVMISDDGPTASAEAVAAARGLDAPVTFVGTPAAIDADLIRRAGHEALLAAPVAGGVAAPARAKVVEGPMLQAGVAERVNAGRLRGFLARVPGVAGVAIIDAGAAAADGAVQRAVARVAAAEGYAFLDGRRGGSAAGYLIARKSPGPAAVVDVSLHSDMSGAAVDRALTRARKHAGKVGSAVLLTEAEPRLLQAVRQATAGAVRLAPLTQALRLRAGRR